MNDLKKSKLNLLQTLLPEGLLVPAAWLARRGYSRSLLAGYVSSGWLESPAHGVYRRPGPPLKWQHVVTSLGRVLTPPPHVGGLSALELRGYAHFLKPRGLGRIELYSDRSLPGWVRKLPLPERFYEHRNRLFLFAADVPANAVQDAASAAVSPIYSMSPTEYAPGLAAEPWGAWDVPLACSLPERAMLEFLNEVPGRQTLEDAELLMQGLLDLNSKRVLALLVACRSIKVKRLFLALAARQSFQWVRPVLAAANRGEVELGSGKRSLMKGGKLDPKYLISVPESSDVRG
ncbi:MAG: hypothetical protein EXR29_07565 [Betaproteobacteria bacterium]|nr:hypothetical protein [Betaproteobacteria bacterium]